LFIILLPRWFYMIYTSDIYINIDSFFKRFLISILINNVRHENSNKRHIITLVRFTINIKSEYSFRLSFGLLKCYIPILLIHMIFLFMILYFFRTKHMVKAKKYYKSKLWVKMISKNFKYIVLCFIIKYFKNKSWVHAFFFVAGQSRKSLGTSLILVLLYAIKSHYYTSTIIPHESVIRYGDGSVELNTKSRTKGATKNSLYLRSRYRNYTLLE